MVKRKASEKRPDPRSELTIAGVTDLFSIENKVIIVTGGGRGIGEHLAGSMARLGAYVYCVDIGFSGDVAPELTGNLFQIECDILHRTRFQRLCNRVFGKHNAIDVLINCAGMSYAVQQPHTTYPQSQWLETMNINLTAAFNCSQAVIAHMVKRRQGSIINITSIVAEVGFPRNPAYAASKGGLKVLGKALAKDWGPRGIRVNNIGPGYIRTDLTGRRYSNRKNREERERRTLLGRWGEKEDLVGPCVFLASEASKYVTGQDIYVDGGWLANSGID